MVSTRQCISCWQWLPVFDFSAKPPTHGCEHDSEICIDCVQQWIHISISTQYQPRIECPHPGCDNFMLGRNDVRRLAHKADYDRYRATTDRISHDMNPDWRHCLRPDCEEGSVCLSSSLDADDENAVWKEEEEKGVHRCIWSCQSKVCVKCDRPWHSGMNCEAFEESISHQRAEEAAGKQFIEDAMREGRIDECGNCACRVEREVKVAVWRCARCFYYNRATAAAVDVEVEEKRKGARRLRGGQVRRVTFAEDV